jgi:hypothetical protein
MWFLTGSQKNPAPGDSIIHLTGYLIHPLMTISFVLACLSTFFTFTSLTPTQSYLLLMQHGITGYGFSVMVSLLQNMIWFMVIPIIVLCTLAPWISAITALRDQRLSLSQNLPSLLVLFLVGFGTSLDNTLGAGRALFSDRAWEWTRTPKYADLKGQAGWRTKKYQISANRVWLLELGLAGLGGFASIHAIQNANYSVLLVLAPFTIAYVFVSFVSILQR